MRLTILKRKEGFIILFKLMILTSWSAEYRLDEKKRLEAPISATDMTRIFVEGDRIHQVFGVEGTYALEVEEALGQIFIKPLEASSVHPIKITLVTEDGLTQDLSLKPTVGAGEAICLKNPTASKRSPLPYQASSHAPAYVETLLRKIRAALNYEIPEGFFPKEISERERLFSTTLQGTLLRAWDNEMLEILVYRLTNKAAYPQALDQKALAHPHDLAIALGAPSLDPAQSTSLITLRRKVPS